MGRTKGLDVRLWAYHEDGRPRGFLESFFYFNRARKRGDVVRFVAEGPDAEQAMNVVKDLLSTPTNTAEAFLEMVTGGPVRLPAGDDPDPMASLERKTRESLARWGLLEAYEQLRTSPVPSRGFARPPARDISQAINRRFW